MASYILWKIDCLLSIFLGEQQRYITQEASYDGNLHVTAFNVDINSYSGMYKINVTYIIGCTLLQLTLYDYTIL